MWLRTSKVPYQRPDGVETGGGFDTSLEELPVFTESQCADVAFMRDLDERFDIFH